MNVVVLWHRLKPCSVQGVHFSPVCNCELLFAPLRTVLYSVVLCLGKHKKFTHPSMYVWRYSLFWALASLSPQSPALFLHPTWTARVTLLVTIITFDLSGMGDPASSYATADVAVRILWPRKPHQCVKVGVSSEVRAMNTSGNWHYLCDTASDTHVGWMTQVLCSALHTNLVQIRFFVVEVHGPYDRVGSDTFDLRSRKNWNLKCTMKCTKK